MNTNDIPKEAPHGAAANPVGPTPAETPTHSGTDSVQGGAAGISTAVELPKGPQQQDSKATDTPGRRFTTINECVSFLRGEGYQNVVSPEHAQGGEGWVFRATDSIENDLAIKVPIPVGNEKQYESGIAKLVREGKAINQLQDCPRVVDILGCRPEGDPCYIVLRWIGGGSLRRRYLDEALSLGVCTGIVRDVAEALCQLHKRGIVHRDVKPANVLLDENHRAWLTDFGLAQIGDTRGEGLGTVGYYPLDQYQAYCEKQTVDPACDIFGLGSIFYEFLYRHFLFVPAKRGSMDSWHEKLKRPLDEIWPAGPVRDNADTLLEVDDEANSKVSDPLFSARSGELATLCREMLDPDFKKRPTAQSVVDQLSDWLTVEVEIKTPLSEDGVPATRGRPPVTIFGKGNLRTSDRLVGRKQLINSLNAATTLSSSRTNVFCIVGSTGLGKSAVVGEWLKDLDQERQWGDFERIIVWSFKTQRTPGNNPNTGLTADQFVEQALRHLHADFQIDHENAIDRGRRLAALIQQQPTLLVLDGLELLQFHRGDRSSGRRQGQCTDQTLVALLDELAISNPGLCVVTAQLPVVDLRPWSDSTVRQERLSPLTTDEGVDLLQQLKVTGPKERLQAAVTLFRGRPAPLVLFGHYVRNVCSGQVLSIDEVNWDDLVEYAHDDSELADVSSNLLENYRQWQARMEHDDEARLLDVVCLFDRPAPIEWLEVVLKTPPIAGLTDGLTTLRKQKLRASLKRLEDWGMLEPDDSDSGDRRIDVPPTVREFFAEQLRNDRPEAWQQAHERLFRSLPGTRSEKPELNDVPTLVAAVWHGVQASLVEEAWQLHDERLNQHVERDGCKMVGVHHLRNQLGSPDSERVSLANFFDELWDRPVQTLPDSVQCEVLRSAGIVLRAVGRFDEACVPLEVATRRFQDIGKPQMAVNALRHLGQTHLMRGNLSLALLSARQAIEIVDSPEGFPQGFERVQARATYANILHHMGRDDEARQQFEKADSEQQQAFDEWVKKHPDGVASGEKPEAPFLYGLAGYRYGHFLLSHGEAAKVIERCADPLTNECSRDYPLAIGLTHVLHARAIDLESQQSGQPVSHQAVSRMDTGVKIVRQTGQYQFVVSAFLARAALGRRRNAFPEARADMADAADLIDACELKRHEVDWRLEAVELALAEQAVNHEQSAELLTEAQLEIETAAALLREFPDYQSCWDRFLRLSKSVRDIAAAKFTSG